MYNANKSFSITSLLIGFVVFVLTVFASLVVADENYTPNAPRSENMMSMSALENVSLPFDPNNYRFLIYVPNGGQDSIEQAMSDLGISLDHDRDVRDSYHPVTPTDLATHNILIVGWNVDGNTDGLHSDDLLAGITGRVILTGHDLDYHESYIPAARTMLIQAIDYVLAGGGTGMITLGCTATPSAFPYLPEEWDVNAVTGGGEDVNEFTPEGLASGVYYGLEPNDMCNWSQSYHDVFTIGQSSVFVPFELGGSNGNDIITVARTQGIFGLTKYDDVPEGNCVLPGQYINYTISYTANGHSDSNVKIIDYLPDELDYNSSTPEGVYDTAKRTVTWTKGTVSIGDSNSYALNVRVNNLAEPCGVIPNLCKIEGDRIRNYARCYTLVCSWNPGIIYVGANAKSGRNTGVQWKDAYLDLQDALDRASNGCGSEIWVAEGTYIPSVEYQGGAKTFQLINGVPLYGHFAGNETAIEQRNLKNPNNETILNGEGIYAWYIVTALGLEQSTIIDGFTITGDSFGVMIENAELTVKNCLITSNASYGIYATNSNFTIADSNIQNNSSHGIHTQDSNFTITDCVIHNNDCGIYVSSALTGARIANSFIYSNVNDGISNNAESSLLIANNWIHHNGGSGIYTFASETLLNDTIVGNGSYGISDLGWVAAPTIRNCIFWNNNDDLIRTGQNWYHPTYSCFTDYNDTLGGTGNIGGDANDPRFVDADSNNFHLDPNSPCIDTGDLAFNDSNGTDIDGECRIVFGKTALRVDMGADEFYWPKADFDRDEIVNFIDYALWAAAWQTNNPAKSLDGDSDVDIFDLELFCDDWLWVAPWSPLYEFLANQPGSGSMVTQSSPEPVALVYQMPAPAVVEVPAAVEEPVVSEEPAEPQPMTIEELVDWLDEIWQAGELTMSEDEYLQFRNDIQ